jgi:hypothetical protein
LVLKDHRDFKDSKRLPSEIFQEYKAIKVFKEVKGYKEHNQIMGFKVLKDSLDCKELGEQLDSRELRVLRACKAHKVFKEIKEQSYTHRHQEDIRVFQDPKATKAFPFQMSDCKDSKDLTAPVILQNPSLEILAFKVPKVIKDFPILLRFNEDSKDSLPTLDLKVFRDFWDLPAQGLKDLKDLKDRKAHKVCKALRELMVPRVVKDYPVNFKDFEAFKGPKDTRVLVF